MSKNFSQKRKVVLKMGLTILLIIGYLIFEKRKRIHVGKFVTTSTHMNAKVDL